MQADAYHSRKFANDSSGPHSSPTYSHKISVDGYLRMKIVEDKPEGPAWHLRFP